MSNVRRSTEFSSDRKMSSKTTGRSGCRTSKEFSANHTRRFGSSSLPRNSLCSTSVFASSMEKYRKSFRTDQEKSSEQRQPTTTQESLNAYDNQKSSPGFLRGRASTHHLPRCHRVRGR